MNRFDNPFHDLWLTEILNPDDFVQMFSPRIVEYADALFGTGNVVVRGRQGSGKSMLLRLLDTKTRVAYARANLPNPIPSTRNFICGSVNLTRSNFNAISARLPRQLTRAETDDAAATFSDFLNCHLARSLLRDILDLGRRQATESNLREIVRIDTSARAQKRLCAELNRDNSWYGAFSSCGTMAQLVERTQQRSDHYSAYFNFNIHELDSSVRQTRTPIGEPLSVLAECLRAAKVIPDDCFVYYKIDQHEELYELEKETGLGDVFRQLINRALAGRDRRSAYRIGTRHYSWTNQVKIWGTAGHLEDMRDYSIVDIDEMFRRPENPRIGDRAFRGFAEDVFRRRLAVAQIDDGGHTGSLVTEVFGRTPTARARARAFATPKARQRHRFPEDWAKGWTTLLAHLREEDPLDAKLGEAWLLQGAQQAAKVFADDRAAVDKPWRQRRWWLKERHEVALMHLASETGQNMTWAGDRHIIGLSGWNILAFMSMCRTIWSGWLRTQSDESLDGTDRPSIEQATQIVGIYEASKLWVDKLREGEDGDRRRTFILAVGEWFGQELRRDKALSNPGHNGFSLLQREFDRRTRSTRRSGDAGITVTSLNPNIRPRLRVDDGSNGTSIPSCAHTLGYRT